MPSLKITWRKGVAYATGSIGGQRIRQSLGTRDAETAAEACALYEARLWKRHHFGEEAVRTFEEAALSYLQQGGEGRYLAPIIRRFRGRSLGTIKPGEITEAAFALYPKAKASTRNRQAIIPARAVMLHAAEKGWCAPIRVTNFPVQKVRRTAVGREWINAFLSRADADGLPHLAAAILFMFQTGSRISETVRVLAEHVDLGERIIWLARTKTDQWAKRHLTDELVVRIANLARETGQPIFGYSSRHSVRTRMLAVCRRAGIPFVSPHQAGRRSAATAALSGGAKIKEVMEAMGWKSARMLIEIYDHAEADDAGQRVAAIFDAHQAQPKPVPRRKSGAPRKILP